MYLREKHSKVQTTQNGCSVIFRHFWRFWAIEPTDLKNQSLFSLMTVKPGKSGMRASYNMTSFGQKDFKNARCARWVNAQAFSSCKWLSWPAIYCGYEILWNVALVPQTYDRWHTRMIRVDLGWSIFFWGGDLFLWIPGLLDLRS